MNRILQFISQVSHHTGKTLLVITTVALLVYYPIFQNDFISSYDDGDFFLQWEGVRSLQNIPSFFAGSLPLKHQHVYRPLRSVMQAIVYQISSTHTFTYHLFGFAVLILSCYFVFKIIAKLRDANTGLIAALFFAVLPIHVESITFMTASFDTAGILFILISFYLYLSYREQRRKKLLFWSALFALLSFFTYEFALTLPVLIILYEIFIKKLQRREIRAFTTRLIPFFSAAFLFLIIKYVVVGRTYFGSFYTHIPLTERLLTSAKTFLQYISLTIINYPLTIHHKVIIANSLTEPSVLGAILFIIGYIVLAYWFHKKHLGIYAFLLLWFFVSMLPVANIVEIANYLSEHYLYLASVAWVALLGMLFAHARANSSWKPAQRAITLTLLCALFLTYSSITWARNKEWKNDVIFWTSTIARQPDDVDAHVNLAFYYTQKEDYQNASLYIKKALEQDPQHALAYGNIGLILLKQAQYDKAILSLSKAIELETNNAGFYLNRGLSYHNLGDAAHAQQDYQEALRLYPNFYDANFNLAVLFIESNRLDEAVTYFERSVKLRPRDHEAYYGLGRAYMEKRDYANAKEYLTKSLNLNPSFVPAQDLLKQL